MGERSVTAYTLGKTITICKRFWNEVINETVLPKQVPLVPLVTLTKIFRLVDIADNCFKFYGRMLLERFSV